MSTRKTISQRLSGMSTHREGEVDGGVVHQDVDAAELCQGGLHHGVDARLVGDVAAHGEGLARPEPRSRPPSRGCCPGAARWGPTRCGRPRRPWRPPCAKPRAMALPIPRLAPVTMATLPCIAASLSIDRALALHILAETSPGCQESAGRVAASDPARGTWRNSPCAARARRRAIPGWDTPGRASARSSRWG